MATKRRGRPPADPTLIVGQLGFVLEVFELVHERGNRRGVLAASIREVADRHDLAADSFERFVHRHRHLRGREDEFRVALRALDDAEQRLRDICKGIDAAMAVKWP